MAPILRTDRLTLTGHAPDDLDDLAAMWGDAAVTAMIGGRPRTREEVWVRLLRAVGQWAVFGYGAWVARETATGAFVGDVGLLEAERAIDPPLTLPEHGWALSPAMQGRGYAQEAVAAVLGRADAHGPRATCCVIDPGNAPSLRLAERVGYAPVRRADYHDAAVIVLERHGPSG